MFITQVAVSRPIPEPQPHLIHPLCFSFTNHAKSAVGSPWDTPNKSATQNPAPPLPVIPFAINNCAALPFDVCKRPLHGLISRASQNHPAPEVSCPNIEVNRTRYHRKTHACSLVAFRAVSRFRDKRPAIEVQIRRMQSVFHLNVVTVVSIGGNKMIPRGTISEIVCVVHVVACSSESVPARTASRARPAVRMDRNLLPELMRASTAALILVVTIS